MKPEAGVSGGAGVGVGGMNEDCPYYERGFCKQGWFLLPEKQSCKFIASHMNHGKICPDYALGFCPQGPNCKQAHVKCVISDADMSLKVLANFPDNENFQDRLALMAN
jgi:hypothetical protein